jgi:outer membrane protein assembly factor BamB
MMGPIRVAAAAFAVLLCLAGSPRPAVAQNVLTYHNTINRHGLFTVPGLTTAAAARIHLAFRAPVSGNVYAQPLYWRPPGAKTGLLIVATESNIVYALNANTGARVWQTRLGRPVPAGTLPCGDISPEGVTGTPVIDPQSGRLYLDATTLQGGGSLPRHMIYALSLSDGKILPNWPLNVDNAMARRKSAFTSELQGERSALQFLKGKIYITYGGRAGDCGGANGAVYRGVVIEVTPAAIPRISGSWETRAARGGIWSQGGATSNGSSLFVTTGNTSGASRWGDGEGVIRLLPRLARSAKAADIFAPANWRDLDNTDADLGGTAAIPFLVNDPSGSVGRLLPLGKDGYAYLLDAANLGGIGRQLLKRKVSNSRIITGPAAFVGHASTWVAFTNLAGLSANCSGINLTMLRITTKPERISTAWCAPISGSGAPIITTTDGIADPIVWVAGAEGDNELHAFDLQTGKILFNGGGTGMSGLHRYGTLIAANRRLYVAGDNTIYAFAF